MHFSLAPSKRETKFCLRTEEKDAGDAKGTMQKKNSTENHTLPLPLPSAPSGTAGRKQRLLFAQITPANPKSAPKNTFFNIWRRRNNGNFGCQQSKVSWLRNFNYFTPLENKKNDISVKNSNFGHCWRSVFFLFLGEFKFLRFASVILVSVWGCSRVTQ